MAYNACAGSNQSRHPGGHSQEICHLATFKGGTKYFCHYLKYFHCASLRHRAILYHVTLDFLYYLLYIV